MATGTIKAAAENVTTLSPANSNITLSAYTCKTFFGTVCIIQFEFVSRSKISAYTSIITGCPIPTDTANIVGLIPDSTYVQLYIDRRITSTPGVLKSRTDIPANTYVRLGAMYAL